MPVRATDDARPGTGRCFMSRIATGEKRRVFSEVHILSTYIVHFPRPKKKQQKYKNIYFARAAEDE